MSKSRTTNNEEGKNAAIATKQTTNWKRKKKGRIKEKPVKSWRLHDVVIGLQES